MQPLIRKSDEEIGEMEFLKIVVALLVFLGLPALITSYILNDIVRVNPDYGTVVGGAIFVGLIWLTMKAWNKAHDYFQPSD